MEEYEYEHAHLTAAAAQAAQDQDDNVNEQEFVLDVDANQDILEIDKLESVGINVSDIKKLKAAGLYTLSSIMMATSATLLSIKGLSEAKVQKITECVKKVGCFNVLGSILFKLFCPDSIPRNATYPDISDFSVWYCS